MTANSRKKQKPNGAWSALARVIGLGAYTDALEDLDISMHEDSNVMLVGGLDIVALGAARDGDQNQNGHQTSEEKLSRVKCLASIPWSRPAAAHLIDQ